MSKSLSKGPPKKSKRAETKPCPICLENIPIRLLKAHAELESQRVEEIVKAIGSTEIIADHLEEGPSSRSRRSAIRARKSLSAMNPRSGDTLEATTKTIQSIKRHRKQRHAKLREMTREEESHSQELWSHANEIVCPVCLQAVRGDQDVKEAHVDACLAYENNSLREEEERNNPQEWETDTNIQATDGFNFRGAGFDLRNRNEQDMEDEVDVDGDDAAVFGDVQFTEGDILGPTNGPGPEDVNVEIEIDGDEEKKSLQDLVAEGRAVEKRSLGERSIKVADASNTEKMDLAIAIARGQGNASALIAALENKLKYMESTQVAPSTSLLCRICLDPYSEATASTGCWHTCCRECWLRCLGSTKLCPICKRITAATELRRIYL